MKSQFSKIAKIRKQKRDAIERELMKSQNKERMLKHKITTLLCSYFYSFIIFFE